tara:strand:- start:3229 stop:3486 length:258 start_codon:yes stop_codon:yes gene_type:complete
MKRKRNLDIENPEIIKNMSDLSLETESKKIKSKSKQSVNIAKLKTIVINDLSLEELEQYRIVLKKKINKYSDYLEKIENILNLYI